LPVSMVTAKRWDLCLIMMMLTKKLHDTLCVPTYIVTAIAMGYRRNQIEAQTEDILDNRLDVGPIVLARGKFTVSGVVVDTNGKPVANAWVYCTGKDQVGINSRTDADGKFKADGIFEGSVQINASIRGDSPRDVS